MISGATWFVFLTLCVCVSGRLRTCCFCEGLPPLRTLIQTLTSYSQRQVFPSRRAHLRMHTYRASAETRFTYLATCSARGVSEICRACSDGNRLPVRLCATTIHPSIDGCLACQLSCVLATGFPVQSRATAMHTSVDGGVLARQIPHK